MTGFVPLIGEAAFDALVNGQYPKWLAEAFGVSVGVAGVATFVLVGGAVGLYNWTERFIPPTIWLVLLTPTLAALLPVPVVMRLVGLVTAGVALLFVGLWGYWRRRM